MGHIVFRHHRQPVGAAFVSALDPNNADRLQDLRDGAGVFRITVQPGRAGLPHGLGAGGTLSGVLRHPGIVFVQDQYFFVVRAQHAEILPRHGVRRKQTNGRAVVDFTRCIGVIGRQLGARRAPLGQDRRIR